MKTSGTRVAYSTFAMMCLGLAVLATAQQPAGDLAAERITVAFSDPSRPGTLRMNLIQGSITVKGENRKDVEIDVRQDDRRRGRAGDAPPGMRRLNQIGGFGVEEENNTLKIDGAPNRNIDFEIRVPARTNLKLGTINGGTLTVDDVEGELEINNTNGPIRLNNVSGSVVANSVNGGVFAKLTRLNAQKAMAFTSLNGAVDVTLPASTKAVLKLRSDHGDVFTDFDVQLRPVSSPTPDDSRRDGRGRYRLEVNRSVYGAINGGGPEIELRTFNGSVFVRKGQ